MTKLGYKAPQELKDLIEEELLRFGLISKPTENHSKKLADAGYVQIITDTTTNPSLWLTNPNNLES